MIYSLAFFCYKQKYMQAILLNSRSLHQDPSFKKLSIDRYNKHAALLKQIERDRHHSIEDITKEVQGYTNILKKAKSTAKIFKKKEEREQLLVENRILLQRVWNPSPIIDSYNDDEGYKYKSGSNKNYQKKRMTEIKEQNKKIGKKIFLQHLQVRQFKKKLKEEIKDYVELRDSIRRLKNVSIKRSHSQMKIEKKAEISLPPAVPKKNQEKQVENNQEKQEKKRSKTRLKHKKRSHSKKQQKSLGKA